MGIRRGPNIVRDGLVFAVDAANPSSFVSGSGVIWKDQTVNQNDGTLTNGPVFDSDGGGRWQICMEIGITFDLSGISYGGQIDCYEIRGSEQYEEGQAIEKELQLIWDNLK